MDFFDYNSLDFIDLDCTVVCVWRSRDAETQNTDRR